MKVNELIGQRLSRIVGRGQGAEFGRRLRPYLGEEWTKGQFYDATEGRRAFRVTELIALAEATGTQAYELLDAGALGVKEVELFGRTIEADKLLDLFKIAGSTAEGPTWQAFLQNRELIHALEDVLDRARETDYKLAKRYTQFPSVEEQRAPSLEEQSS